jgi:hypothetical protein
VLYEELIIVILEHLNLDKTTHKPSSLPLTWLLV